MKTTRDHLVPASNGRSLLGLAHRRGSSVVATGPPYDRTVGMVALLVDGLAAAGHDIVSLGAGSLTVGDPPESREPIGTPESAVR